MLTERRCRYGEGRTAFTVTTRRRDYVRSFLDGREDPVADKYSLVVTRSSNRSKPSPRCTNENGPDACGGAVSSPPSLDGDRTDVINSPPRQRTVNPIILQYAKVLMCSGPV